MITIGQPAPDFELYNQENQLTRLSQLRGRKVVLFFFPKAAEFSSGCNAQACAFRDEFTDLQAMNAVVLGISHDTPQELKKWKEFNHLSYDLLSDPGYKVHIEWGTKMNLLSILPVPMTNRSYFVIDEAGIVIDMKIGVAPKESAKKALEAVRKASPSAAV